MYVAPQATNLAVVPKFMCTLCAICALCIPAPVPVAEIHGTQSLWYLGPDEAHD